MQPGSISWIDVRGLGDGSIVTELGELLGLHALALADVVNVGQRPKVERYEGFLFVVLRMLSIGESGALHWEQVSLFLAGEYVLTFHETPRDSLEPLRERIRSGRLLMHQNKADFLAYSVIDAVVDGYFPMLESYSNRLEQLEDSILLQDQRNVLSSIFVVKRDLAELRRACWPLREALSQLLKQSDAWLSESVSLHLRDTLDHTMQVVEVNETYREMASSLADMQMSMVNQKTNDIMRVLTVVSAIFIPLTFVAGIYGMNFEANSASSIPELRWSYGYQFFWAVCLGVGLSLLYVFFKLGWLRR